MSKQLDAARESRRRFLFAGGVGVLGAGTLGAQPAWARFAVTLTLTCQTARTATPGASIWHLVKLLNGAHPFANQRVDLFDPVIGSMVWLTADRNGQVVHTVRTNSQTTLAVHTLVAVYGTLTRTTSTVAVRSSSEVTLSEYKVNLVPAAVPNNPTLVVGERLLGNGLTQSLDTTAVEAARFGREVAIVHLGKPGILPIGPAHFPLDYVTSVSTPSNIDIPAAGRNGVPVAVRFAFGTADRPTVEAVGTRLIDASIQSLSDKALAKQILASGTAAFEFAMLRPHLAFEPVGALSRNWTYLRGSGLMVSVGARKVGFSVAAPIVSTDRVLQMSCYRPDTR